MSSRPTVAIPSLAALRFAFAVLCHVDDRHPAITIADVLADPPYNVSPERARQLIALSLTPSDAPGGSPRV